VKFDPIKLLEIIILLESTNTINGMYYWLSYIILKLIGWKVAGPFPRDVKKKILVAAPHTSNWDFPLGILIRGVLKDKIKYVGKDSLFKPPMGWLLKRMGGISVDRSKSNNFVEAVVKAFDKREELSILFAAEGKRKKVEKFKTGFYYIAKNAKVPILPTILDYDKKEFRFTELIWPSDNDKADIAMIENIFKGIRGYHAKYSFHYDMSKSKSE